MAAALAAPCPVRAAAAVGVVAEAAVSAASQDPEADPAQGATGQEEPAAEEDASAGRDKGTPGQREAGKRGGKERPERDPAEGDLKPGQVRVRADTQGGAEGHYWFHGFADLATPDARIQADSLDLYQEEQPDGTRRRHVVAVGNVVFMRGDERLAGERLDFDLDAHRGVFERVHGYLQPGVFVEADTIERRGDGTYRISGGRFTSCAQPTPRWSFSASSATVKPDDKIVGHNVVFRVKSVPALYIPYFIYPIHEDERATGFLFPHFGYSNVRGFNVGSGFFWAMGRSADQTFYFDRYSRFGYGFGHELRYIGERPSLGTFRSYVFRLAEAAEPAGEDAQPPGRWDFDLDWNAIQQLPGGVRANATVRLFSDLQFQRQIQDNLNLASTRRQRASLNLQRRLRGTTFKALVDSSDTFYGQDDRVVNRHLPSFTVTRSRQKVGHTGLVFSYEARAERLARGDQDAVDSWSRFDLAPEIARPVALSFLQITPRVQVRYTRWGSRYDEDGQLDGAPLERRYAESSVELRGPTFSRVFLNEGGFYSDKFKHVIGPEITWSYRTAVDSEDFAVTPRFDGVDRLLGTHQIQYALVQTLLAKRPDENGRLVPWEVLSWRLQQTYYVQIGDSQNEFDPNYSTSAFGPGGTPDHNSPLSSRLAFRPSRDWTTSFNAEYDVNFKQLRTLSLSTRFNRGHSWFDANWTRSLSLAEDPAERERTRDFLRSSAAVDVSRHVRLQGGVDWDILNKNVLRSQAKFQWNVQCCGFSLEALQYDYGDRQEREVRFSIELANIGSMGSFMGQPGEQAGAGRLQ